MAYGIYLFDYSYQKPGFSKTRNKKEIHLVQSEYAARQKLEEYHSQKGEKVVDIFKVTVR